MRPKKHPLTAFETLCASVMKTKITGNPGEICYQMLVASCDIVAASNYQPEDTAAIYADVARKLLQLEFGPGEGRFVANLIMEATETIDMVLAAQMIFRGEPFIPAEMASELKLAFQQDALGLAVPDDIITNTLAVLSDRIKTGLSADDILQQAGGEMNGRPVADAPTIQKMAEKGNGSETPGAKIKGEAAFDRLGAN